MEVLAKITHRFDHVGILLNSRVGRFGVHKPLKREICQIVKLANVSWQCCQSILVQIEFCYICQQAELLWQPGDEIVIDLEAFQIVEPFEVGRQLLYLVV